MRSCRWRARWPRPRQAPSSRSTAAWHRSGSPDDGGPRCPPDDAVAGVPRRRGARCERGSGPRGGAGNGSWATHRRVDAGHLFRVPDGLDLRTAALAEPTGVALRAVRRSGARAGDRVLVTGAGSIGLLAVAILAELGADVVV